MVSKIIGILTLISICFGTYFFLEKHYALKTEHEALAAEVVKVKERLDYKILSDQLSATQNRLWQLEDRYQNKKMDNTANEEYRSLKEQKDSLKGKLDKMEKVK